MRTQKQIAASRANGRKSAGATTPVGKARIVAANLTAGIYAETEILPWEKAEDFEKLKAEYYTRHRATSPEARCLLDDLIDCEWTLRRLRHASQAILLRTSQGPTRHVEANTFTNSELSMARLQSRITATRLAFQRALKTLQHLEAQESLAAEAVEAVEAEEAAVEPKAPETPETPSATPSPETDLQDGGRLTETPKIFAPQPAMQPAESALILPEAS